MKKSQISHAILYVLFIIIAGFIIAFGAIGIKQLGKSSRRMSWAISSFVYETLGADISKHY